MKRIGWRIIYGCDDLKEISVDSNNHMFDSRYNCNAVIETANNKLILGCSKTTIPNGIKTIGAFAFAGCNTLESIVIPDSVELIEEHAFADCANLKYIWIPDSVSEIQTNAFDMCGQVKISIPFHLKERIGSFGVNFGKMIETGNIDDIVHVRE